MVQMKLGPEDKLGVKAANVITVHPEESMTVSKVMD